jgi:hypothetical protein
LLWGMARSSMNGCKMIAEELEIVRECVHKNHWPKNKKGFLIWRCPNKLTWRPTEAISNTETEPSDGTSSYSQELALCNFLLF